MTFIRLIIIFLTVFSFPAILSAQDVKQYLISARNFQEKGEIEKAIAEVSKAIEIDPSLENAYELRGKLYVKKEKYQEAIADFTKLIELKPNEAFIYALRANAKRKSGDSAGADGDMAQGKKLRKQAAPRPPAKVQSGSSVQNKFNLSRFEGAQEMRPDALAKSILRTLSTSCETYATANRGQYPQSINDLMESRPPYLSMNYCQETTSGFVYTCEFFSGGYKFVAQPVENGLPTFTITTGGVLTPQ